MPFWTCYYHIVWATKHRQPIITPEREGVIFATVRRVSNDLRCQIRAINGVADHVHVAVAIPPGVAVAQWVKQSKGASSRMANEAHPTPERFGWQAGYGVLTFGEKMLPYVVGYIGRQKEHHANQQIEAYLERVE